MPPYPHGAALLGATLLLAVSSTLASPAKNTANSAANSAASAPCPGGATWCDGFERGAAKWSGNGAGTSSGTGAILRMQAGGNHVLPLRANAGPLLLPAADTAAHTGKAYYVEARLRPVSSGASGAGDNSGRQGYVIARWVDERNWLGFGLHATPGNARMGLDMVLMQDGELKFLGRAGTEIAPGGSFYTLRLDVDGSALTISANGSRILGRDEPALNSMPPGRIGALALGGDFELDDLRIGDARTAPMRIGLVHMNNRLSLQAGDAAQRYPVRVFGAGGVQAAPFTVASSDPAVASAGVDGDVLVVTPRRAGRATITVARAGDNNLALALDANIGPAFTVPGTASKAASKAAPALDGRVLPAPRAADVQVDTPLQLRFDGAPTLAASGSVRIYRAADDKLVDVIRAGSEVNVIGAGADGFRRVVSWSPLQVDGATVTIRPHGARLAYGTEYYVLVDAGLFQGATLAGKPFAGIGKAARWTFRTRAAPPTADVLSVDDDGPADFRTVQGALDHAMRTMARAAPVTIRIADGRYADLLYLRGKDNVTLRGASRDGAVIAVRNADGLNPGSGSGQAAGAPGAGGGRSVFLVEDADLLHLDNLTIVNTTLRDKPLGGQAEALHFASDGRLMATNASFISEQDTILVRGWSWFYRSLIAGNVDFIWGYNRAALFEEDEIRTLGNGNKGGYIVQARTPNRDDPGFVFLNSRITHGPGPSGDPVPPGTATLARPGTATTWDNVSYINCRIGEHIAPTGWSGQPRAGAGWYEFNSMDSEGKPLDLSRRSGGRVLSAEEAARFTSRAAVFAGYDNGKGWLPAPPPASSASSAAGAP